MAKDLYQAAGKSGKKGADERKRQNKKKKKRSICIAVFSLLLVACSALSERRLRIPLEGKIPMPGE